MVGYKATRKQVGFDERCFWNVGADMIDLALQLAKDNPELSTLCAIVAALFATYGGMKILGKDLWWVLTRIKHIRLAMVTAADGMSTIRQAALLRSIELRMRFSSVGSMFWFRFVRRRKLHLKFEGPLKNTLILEGLQNERVHAALLNVWLQRQMNYYIDNTVTNELTVSANVSALVKEARDLDPEGYHIWVATVASELVLDCAKYAEDGYTIPWEGVSEPFLRSVWQKGDP